jgi:outer membrane protein assembly factor BamC
MNFRVFWLLGLLLLSACETTSDLLESTKVDYKSAGKIPDLDVPPDLTRPKRDDRFVVPDIAVKGAATYSAYAAERGPQGVSDQDVLPAVANMHIERDGVARWLVVPGTPEGLWPQLKEFWQENGFIVNIETPLVGVMETDWAENRAKVPQGFIREALGKALDTFYSTPERDKFRLRLEPGKNQGTTDIYITHRGMIEVYVNEGRTETRWQPRPSDTELENEMLRRLMVKLGADKDRARVLVAQASSKPASERAVLSGGSGTIELKEPFDRAWRSVGLALDRSNFTIEDRDRSKGVYFVRYVDSDVVQANQGKPGFFSKLAFWKDSTDKPRAIQYQVLVVSQGENAALVRVSPADAQMNDTLSSQRILNLLFDRLK